jgi:hypothetical protein
MDPDPGLCGSCRHSHVITNARGSRFYLCRRAHDDPAFHRYPPLPVSACAGFESTANRRRIPEGASQ